MSSLEKTDQTRIRDLALLGQMVGVQKALHALRNRRVPLTIEVVMGVLEAQEEIYLSEALFEKKGMALREIISDLEQGTLGIDAVLQAAGVDPTKMGPSARRFNLRRIWDSIWP